MNKMHVWLVKVYQCYWLLLDIFGEEKDVL